MYLVCLCVLFNYLLWEQSADKPVKYKAGVLRRLVPGVGSPSKAVQKGPVKSMLSHVGVAAAIAGRFKIRLKSRHRQHFALAAILLVACTGCLCRVAAAQATRGIMITEFYSTDGHHGGSTAFQNSFVQLFNSTGSAVNLNGWSLQWASASAMQFSNTVTPGSILALTGANGVLSLSSGAYLVIDLGNASGTGVALPAGSYDGSAFTTTFVGTSGMLGLSTTSGAIAFTAGPNSTFSTNMEDFVGYGSAVSYQGSAPAPNVSNGNSGKGAIQRQYNGGGTNYANSGTSIFGTSTPSSAPAATGTTFTGPSGFVAEAPMAEPAEFVFVALGAVPALRPIRRRRSIERVLSANR
jgi:hypothetical protein